MSSTAASTVPSSTACANLYDTPIKDAVCAMPYKPDHVALMLSCCKKAEVVSYYNDCGLYCIAKDQSVTDLVDCLYSKGAAWEDVFCKGNDTATATATGSANLPASASASVVQSSDAKSTKGSHNTDDDDNTDNNSDDSDGAAAGIKPSPHVSALCLAIGALVFFSTTSAAI